MVPHAIAIAEVLARLGIPMSDNGTGRAHPMSSDRSAALELGESRGDGPAHAGPDQATAFDVIVRYTGDPYLAEGRAVSDGHAIRRALCLPGAVAGAHIAPADGLVLDGMAPALADLVVLRLASAGGDVFDAAEFADVVQSLFEALTGFSAAAVDPLVISDVQPGERLDDHRAINRLPITFALDLAAEASWLECRAALREAALVAGLVWVGDDGRPAALLDSHTHLAADVALYATSGGSVRLDSDDALILRLPFILHRST